MMGNCGGGLNECFGMGRGLLNGTMGKQASFLHVPGKANVDQWVTEKGGG